MTRQEFIDSVNCFTELLDFCNEHGLVSCEYVMDERDFDDWIDGQLYDWARYERWYEVKDRLDDIPTGYEWYDTEEGVTALDEYDFPIYKDRVLEEADNEGDVWGDEEKVMDLQDVDDVVDSDELISKLIITC